MSIKTMTAVGNAQIDTAQSKFGGASGLFDGTGDYLTTPDSSDWALGTGKFTIDCWFRLNTTGGATICGQKDAADSFWGFNVKTTGTDNITFGSITSGSWDVNFNATVTINTGTWYHLAVVRDGTTDATWYLFLDGIEKTKTLAIGSYTGTILDASSVFYIGSLLGTFAVDLNGWIDEFRFSKGIARWTSNFTPPTSAYTTDANTNLLLHMDGTDASTTFTDDSVVANTTNFFF